MPSNTNEASSSLISAFGLRSNVSVEDEVALLSGGERQSATALPIAS